MSESEESVSKIVLQNETIFFRTFWGKLSLRLWIFENNSTWYGAMSPQDFQELSVESLDPVHQYFQKFKNAIAMKDPTYELDIRRVDTENIELLIKRRHALVINIYGLVKLRRNNDLDKNYLIEYMVFKISDLISDTVDLEDKNRCLASQLNYAKIKWQEEAETKNKMEKQLCTKFVELINTKKKYIQALEDMNKQ